MEGGEPFIPPISKAQAQAASFDLTAFALGGVNVCVPSGGASWVSRLFRMPDASSLSRGICVAGASVSCVCVRDIVTVSSHRVGYKLGGDKGKYPEAHMICRRLALS